MPSSAFVGTPGGLGLSVDSGQTLARQVAIYAGGGATHGIAIVPDPVQDLRLRQHPARICASGTAAARIRSSSVRSGPRRSVPRGSNAIVSSSRGEDSSSTIRTQTREPSGPVSAGLPRDDRDVWFVMGVSRCGRIDQRGMRPQGESPLAPRPLQPCHSHLTAAVCKLWVRKHGCRTVRSSGKLVDVGQPIPRAWPGWVMRHWE